MTGGQAGQRQEHVVERRSAQRDVGQWDVRCAQQRKGLQECVRASGRRNDEAIRVRRQSRPVPFREERAKCCGYRWKVLGIARDDLAVTPTRPFLEFVGGSLGDDDSVIDHDDAVAEGVGLLEILRGQQRRDPSALEPGHQVPDALSASRIEPRGGLVEEDHRGRDHQAAGDVDAPAHATRIGSQTAIGGVDQIEFAQEFVSPRLGLACAQVLQAPEENQILTAREHFVERDVLPGEHDRLAYRGRLGDDVKTGHGGAAPIRLGESRQDVHRGGLAGSVGTKQRNDFAGLDLKTDVAQRM